MKSLAEPMGVSMGEIYRSIIPFTLLLLVGMAIIMLFPGLALWLPSTMITR
jgi:TRAP-type mannitol/chloroaromatic compound transport system permease large subunit